MTDQEIQDQQIKEAMESGQVVEPGSKELLQALLKKKSENSSKKEPSSDRGPLAWAVENYPGLTEEEALEMAEEFGF